MAFGFWGLGFRVQGLGFWGGLGRFWKFLGVQDSGIEGRLVFSGFGVRVLWLTLKG